MNRGEKLGSILAVPGLGATSAAFRYALLNMAQRNGWDVDAIATVMSLESGFRPERKNPKATASGLIQMIDQTAKAVGVSGGAAALRQMSAVEQLPYVERFYQMTLRGRSHLRPVDYYLAGWGEGVGRDSAHVLARESDPRTFSGGRENKYTLNAALDRNGSGEITVGDLAAHVAAQQSKARGVRLDVFAGDAGPLAVGAPAPAPLSFLEFCSLAPVLRVGAASEFVHVLEFMLRIVPPSPELRATYRRAHELAVREFQERNALTVDGVCGPKTWSKVLEPLRGEW